MARDHRRGWKVARFGLTASSLLIVSGLFVAQIWMVTWHDRLVKNPEQFHTTRLLRG